MEANGSKNFIEDGAKCCFLPEFDTGYGFGAGSGWKGLGIYKYCTSCYKTIEFIDDIECNSPEEIEHNKNKREGLL